MNLPTTPDKKRGAPWWVHLIVAVVFVAAGIVLGGLLVGESISNLWQ